MRIEAAEARTLEASRVNADALAALQSEMEAVT